MEKHNPSEPRVHGNGFLQIDLDPFRRMHIWDHRFPRQVRDSSIHDHAFAFKSWCLEGTLINVALAMVREAEKYPTHEIYAVERPNPNSEEDVLVPVGRQEHFMVHFAETVHAGTGYSLRSHVFHVSLHLGTTVTVMRRDPEYKGGGKAYVASRIGEEPDNDWIRTGHDIPGWAYDLISKYQDFDK